MLPCSTAGDEMIPIKYTYQKSKAKKPKRNKSAFILFSIEMRAKLKGDNQDQVNSNEMMVKLAELWKHLPKVERERYHTEAKDDKKRYLQELENFSKTHPSESIHNKTKKNHIKKPCSAYAIFLKEMKKLIKSQSPELKMADVLKIVSEKWKNLPEKEKRIYQERAQIEKELTRVKLGENIINSKTISSKISEKTVKKVKIDDYQLNHLKEEESAFKLEDSQNQHIKLEILKTRNPSLLSETILSTGVSLTQSDTSARADFALLERVPNDINFPLLSMFRTQNPGLIRNSNIINKELNMDEGRRTFSLFDTTVRKSTELLAGLLNYSMSVERFDTMNIFKNNSLIPSFNPLIQQMRHRSNEEIAIPTERRLLTPSRQQLINNTIMDALKVETQDNSFGVKLEPFLMDLVTSKSSK